MDFTSQGDSLLIPDNGSTLSFDLRTRELSRVSLEKGVPAQKACAPAGDTVTPQVGFTNDFAKAWQGFRSMMLLVARRCNLECVYCYASALPSGPLMPMQMALDATETYFSGKPEQPSVVFHGGGEPTLNMPVMRAVCARARELAPTCQFAITTNGTASDEVLEFLMQYGFNIMLSWDGPPEVQNHNRPFAGGQPSSRHLERTSKVLADHKYPFTVQTTITATTDAAATVNYFADHGVTVLKLEPLFPYGRKYSDRESYDVPPPTAGDLVRVVMTAMDACDARGVKLTSTSFDKDGLPSWHGRIYCGNACGRTMVVTHDGQLSACNEVADCSDPLSHVFFFGGQAKVGASWTVDGQRLMPFLKRHVDRLPDCNQCPARLSCGGGCVVKAYRASGSLAGRDPINCEFIREIVPLLIKRAAQRKGV